MRILVVEDDIKLANSLRRGLEEEKYAVDVAHDGVAASELMSVVSYDLALVDIMMPKKDGLELVKELRATGNNVPVIFLTAKDTVTDRVRGLDSGADDYLVKPFSFVELCARIRAVLRREAPTRNVELNCGDVVLDPVTHTVRKGREELSLTAREFAILEYLLRNKGRVVTRNMIMDHVWDYNSAVFSNVVDVHISFLRKKIEGPNEKIIHTVRGMGYMIKEEDEEP